MIVTLIVPELIAEQELEAPGPAVAFNDGVNKGLGAVNRAYYRAPIYGAMQGTAADDPAGFSF